MVRSKDEDRERKERERRAQGIEPRRIGPSETWLTYGMSRSSYYRRLQTSTVSDYTNARARASFGTASD